MSDYIVQSDREYLVLVDPTLPPIYQESRLGAHVGTTRTIETYASAEQAEARMREIIPGWELNS